MPKGLRSVAQIAAEDTQYKDLTSRFQFIEHSWFVNGPVVTALLNQLRPRRICEIGTWMGASARFQASHPAVEEVVCVDHWDRKQVPNWVPGTHPEEWMDNMYEHFLANCIHAKLDQKIFPVRHNATAGAVHLASLGLKFDWIYIDGSHATIGVMADILNYLPLLAPNGFMCGDDWDWVTEPDNVRGGVMAIAPHIGAQVHAHGNFWWYTFPNRRS